MQEAKLLDSLHEQNQTMNRDRTLWRRTTNERTPTLLLYPVACRVLVSMGSTVV